MVGCKMWGAVALTPPNLSSPPTPTPALIGQMGREERVGGVERMEEVGLHFLSSPFSHLPATFSPHPTPLRVPGIAGLR